MKEIYHGIKLPCGECAGCLLARAVHELNGFVYLAYHETIALQAFWVWRLRYSRVWHN